MEPIASRKVSSRTAIVAMLGCVALAWLGVTALAAPDLPDYRAGGTPRTLPVAGTLPSSNEVDFAGLLAGQAGRPVVVNVWASWCAPCRAEMPLLAAAAAEYDGRVTFIGVASNDQIGDAAQFLNDIDVRYPNVFDHDGSIARALRVSAYPTTFVVGVDGAVTARVDGGISEQRLAGLVSAAIG